MKERIKAFFETADKFDFVIMVLLGLALFTSLYSMVKSDLMSETLWANTIVWLLLCFGAASSLLVERSSLIKSLAVIFGLICAMNQILFWAHINNPRPLIINMIVSLVLILFMIFDTSPKKVFDRGV